jgi:hypothetical protein
MKIHHPSGPMWNWQYAVILRYREHAPGESKYPLTYNRPKIEGE